MSNQVRMRSQANVRTSATVPSRQREAGASNNKSYIPISTLGVPSEIREVEVGSAATRQARNRRTSRFLKGPIPWEQIATAAQLGGQCLAVYVAVHHRTALTGQMPTTLPRALLQQLGVSKDAKARALRQLERAGLIGVRRAKGRTARVSLIDRQNVSTTQAAAQ
jgi:DNA-binding MarR family transcriptional regulator